MYLKKHVSYVILIVLILSPFVVIDNASPSTATTRVNKVHIGMLNYNKLGRGGYHHVKKMVREFANGLGSVQNWYSNLIFSTERLFNHKTQFQNSFVSYERLEYMKIDTILITNLTIIKDKTVVVEGNITIGNGGTLMLLNSTILVNSSKEAINGLKVLEGGNLTIVNSTVMAYNPTYPFYVMVLYNSRFYMEGSEIRYAGIPTTYNFTYWGVFVSTDNATVRNSVFAYNLYGIFLINAKNACITNNTFLNNAVGLSISSSFNNAVVNNTFYNDGIYITGVVKAIIENNTVNDKPLIYLENTTNEIVENAGQVIINNCENITVRNTNISHVNAGIEVLFSNSITLLDNNISDCGIGVLVTLTKNLTIIGNKVEKGGFMIMDSKTNVIRDNTVNGLPLVYLENKSNQVIENAGQVFVYNSRNITIKNSHIHDVVYSIWIQNSSSITIKDSNMYRNGQGCMVVLSQDIYLENNNVTTNGFGLFVGSSNNVLIKGNHIENNRFGVDIYSSSKVTVEGNVINKNEAGIVMFLAKTVTLLLDKIIGNNDTGIAIMGPFQNVKINFCDIYGNMGFGVNTNDLGYYSPYLGKPIDASYNWWGSTSGPEYKNVSDPNDPDEIWGNIIYKPWLNASYTTVKPIEVIYPMNGTVFTSKTVNVSWRIYPIRSIAKVEIRMDLNKWIDVTNRTNYTFTNLSLGNHTIQIRAIDEALNVYIATIQITIKGQNENNWGQTIFIVASVITVLVALVAIKFIKEKKP